MNFYESLQKGRQAEVLVKHAFEAMGYMVDDVTSMPAY